MSETRRYTTEQLLLITEFAAYGIDENDIIFYSEKPEPFFTYEATASLCQQLTDVQTIDLEPITAFEQTTAIHCRLGFGNGKSCSAAGIVNHSEYIDGESMSEHQRISLASARAIRNALKASGINLLKAHYQLRATGELAEPTLDMLRTKHLAEAHALGKETGFIVGDNKNAWYSVIYKRYGLPSSKDLTNEQLADFVAFLRSCLQQAA